MLVEDRELGPKDPDRFRHEDIVAQLADLATQAKPPANIALYGPWGSGKSSIASHLEAELARRDAPVRFARYDAFRFAQLPLQRHFIRHLATKLEVKNEKYGRRLYEDTTTNDLILGSPEDGRPRQLLGLLLQTLLILTVALAGAVAVTAAAAAIGSWVSEHDSFGSNFVDYLRNNTLGFLAPAGLLALFGALAGKKLSVTRGASAPTSEDQFAATFNDLVTDALAAGVFKRNPDRLVIFIDELDRCDGRTVVATLDSLRSFLDADRCIFIVAADQQVLETALTSYVRQSTPSDPANPYYSAGSEYLDKTFHYQLSLPDLLPRRLSGFAADLVRGKPGPWSEVASIERVVSVLIPNHVRSPRRAKTLLNSFALLFELARRRCDVGHLAGDPVGRAEEIAVLACLRVEFPLFARELRQHPRLIEAARASLHDPEDRPNRIPDDTWVVAREFIEGKRAVDVLLTAEAPLEDSPPDEDPAENATSSLRAAQSHQLQAYLRKTGYVPCPERDLIHLESGGALFGIDAADAAALEDSASQADTRMVNAILDRLGDQRYIGLLALAESLDREVPPLGHEADNLVSVVLGLYAAVRAEPTWSTNPTSSEIKRRFSTAINAHTRTYELRADDLPGALALGLDAGDVAGESLVTTVLAHEAALNCGPLILVAIGVFGALREQHGSEIAALATNGLTSPEQLNATAAAICDLDGPFGVELVEATLPGLTANLRSLLGSVVEPPETPAAEVAEEAEPADPEVAISQASRNLLDAFTGRVELLQRVAVAVLDVDHVGARRAVEAYLADLASDGDAVEFAALSRALLKAAQHRVPQSITLWLARVRPSHLDQAEACAAADALVTKVWTTLDKDNDGIPEYFAELLPMLDRLLPEPLGDDSALARVITQALIAPASDAEATHEHIRLERVEALTDIRVLLPATAAEIVANVVQKTLAAAVQAPTAVDGTVQRWVARAAQFVSLHGSASAATPVLTALKSSPWFLGTERVNAELAISAGARGRGEDVESPYTAAEVAQLVVEHGEALDVKAARWLNAFAPDASDAQALLDSLFARRPTSGAIECLNAYVSGLTADDQLGLVQPEVRRCLDSDPRIDLLRILRLPELDAARIAKAIVDTFALASKMDHRRRLLEVWAEAQIKDGPTRARLINEVLLPTARAGVGGLDLAIRHVELWRDPPHGTKGSLRELRKVASGDQKDRLTRALMEAGLIKEEKGWLGLGPTSYKDID